MADTNGMGAVELENLQLRGELEKLSAERGVVQEALNQILQANIAVQTNNVLFDKNNKLLQAENEELKKTINDLMQKLAVANKVIEASTNLKAGEQAPTSLSE